MLAVVEPNLEEPVTKSVDDVIVCTTIVCAVNVPLTVKLSADDAVDANDADNDCNAYEADSDCDAYDAVPNNDPVNEVANTVPLTCRVPDTGVFNPIPTLPDDET